MNSNPRTTMRLFIGGPCDGQTLPTNPDVPYWKVAIHTKVKYGYCADRSMQDVNSFFHTASYQRMSLGSHIFYIHEDLTFNEAIGMLLDHYEKKNTSTAKMPCEPVQFLK